MFHDLYLIEKSDLTCPTVTLSGLLSKLRLNTFRVLNLVVSNQGPSLCNSWGGAFVSIYGNKISNVKHNDLNIEKIPSLRIKRFP